MPTCPKCNHSWGTKRKAPASSTVDPRTVDTSEMSTAELFKWRHDTAPAEDIRFYLEHAYLSPGLRIWFQGLDLARPNLSRAEFYRQFWELKVRWSNEKYWERVIVPSRRLARRLDKARTRRPAVPLAA